jgi:hypothetical protein
VSAMSNEEKNSERRVFDRISDKSQLLASGHDVLGVSFIESSKVNDVSSAGISFYLTREPAQGRPLELIIGDMEEDRLEFVSSYSVRVRVINVTPSPGNPGQFRIGARFEGEIQQLKNTHTTEALAEKLKHAVAQDEHRRHLN